MDLTNVPTTSASPRPGTRATVRRGLAARYDAAAVTDDNRRQWQNVDALSAAAALSPMVRTRLRNRCRYEVANNSYAKGIGLTIAKDTVGTGPQLQMLTGDKATNKEVERKFWQWTKAVRLAEKFRLMRFARYDSGEAFGIFTNNPGLRTPVKLDLTLRESEECADPRFSIDRANVESDGIDYDEWGNPKTYRFLKTHPGALMHTGLPTEAIDVPAARVFHYFHPDRPGQLRGIPDVTPSVSLFNDLRRYSSAVIAAAETAADYSAIMKTMGAPDDSDDVDDDFAPMDTFNLEKRMGLVLPKGWDLTQLRAEQPTTTYDGFVSAKLKEIARCLNVPFTVASLDSSVGNMSSAYVDRQTYTNHRLMDRAELEELLETLFELWLAEARLIEGYLPELEAEPAHQFFWPSLGHHADPQKVANAAAAALKCGLTSLPKEHAKNGDDWEEQQESAAKALGLSVEQYRAQLVTAIFGPAPAPPPDDDDENEQPKPGVRAVA